MKSKMKVLSIVGVAATGLMVAASAAFACVSLATLEVSPGKGAAGTVVTAKATSVSTTTGSSDVELRWGGLTGPLLAKAKPTAANMTFNFTVPEAAAGTYVVVVTQTDPAGAPAWGMPARATFVVPAAAAGIAPAAEAAAAPETVVVEQKYVVQGETPAAAPAQAAAKAAPRQAAVQAPVAPAAPEAAPAAPLSLEARDAITQTVAPAGAREVNYVPAASRAQSSSSLSLRLGIALAIVGSMALLTAAGAAYILRPARAASHR